MGGMRISEALTLAHDDVDLDVGVLTIRQTKFQKSRLAPFHARAIGSLRDYATARDRRHSATHRTTFFVSMATVKRLTVRQTFHKLVRAITLNPTPSGRSRPRLHDMRHTIACRRVLAFYRDGSNIDRAVDHLSTYLGQLQIH